MPEGFNFVTPPFDLLLPHERGELHEALHVTYYTPEEVLLAIDEPVDRLFVLLKGVVEERGDDGRLFAQYTCDDLFDVRGLFTGRSKHCYRAVEESIVYELPVETFHRLCRMNPEFGRFFQADLAVKRQLAQQDGQNLAEFMLTRVAPMHLLPALEVDSQLSLSDAARMQVNNNADAILVKGPEGPGIVTRTDLMRAHFQDGKGPDVPVGQLAHRPLVGIELGDFLFDAMILMTRKHIERVAVWERGRVVGLLNLTQVLSLFSTHSHVLAMRIARAKTTGELRVCADSLHQLIATLSGNGVRLRFIMQLISALNDQLLERLFSLLIPPALQQRCCLVVMGSEGRAEQLLKTDQDNALILSDDVPLETGLEAMQCFTTALLDFGYPLCPGGVMASNRQWCQHQKDWLAELRQTRLEGTPEQLLRVAILADAWPVAGDSALFAPVLDSLVAFGRDCEHWMTEIATATLQFDTPLTFLGQLKTHGTFLDIKRGGVFPIVHGTRALALREGIQARGTVARLKALKQQDVLDGRLVNNVIESFELFLSMRLSQQLVMDADGRRQGLNIDHMKRHERDMLRYGLHTVKKFKQHVARQFHLEIR